MSAKTVALDYWIFSGALKSREGCTGFSTDERGHVACHARQRESSRTTQQPGAYQGRPPRGTARKRMGTYLRDGRTKRRVQLEGEIRLPYAWVGGDVGSRVVWTSQRGGRVAHSSTGSNSQAGGEEQARAGEVRGGGGESWRLSGQEEE
jgi:hypothetical protein